MLLPSFPSPSAFHSSHKYRWRPLISFADRQFYEDWWNSTSWDEFSRKWNKPVHAFLLRHVYAATITSYRVSRTTAMFVTFLLSACAHELVMAVVTRKFRMYLFTMQVCPFFLDPFRMEVLYSLRWFKYHSSLWVGYQLSSEIDWWATWFSGWDCTRDSRCSVWPMSHIDQSRRIHDWWSGRWSMGPKQRYCSARYRWP